MSQAEIRCGDALTELRLIPDASVRCCVTSPPYWGLRDYGVAGQLGLESTPEEYISRMVEVFREVRGALAADGTLWLNLGDSYATGAGKVGECPGGGDNLRGADGDRIRDEKRGYRGDRLPNGRGDHPAILRQKTRATRDGTHAGKHTAMAALGPMTQPNRLPLPGLKAKDLIGIPWRVALALQADGWYLRADIIWHKTNPMPESVRDRPTKAHEYLFLFSKSERYFYDADAICEPAGYAHEAHLDPGTNGLGGGCPPHREDDAEVQVGEQGPEDSARSRRRSGYRIESAVRRSLGRRNPERPFRLDDSHETLPRRSLRHVPRRTAPPLHPRRHGARRYRA